MANRYSKKLQIPNQWGWRRIESWYNKGKKDKNPFDKMIYYWIAFNSYYDVTHRHPFYKTKSGEERRIEESAKFRNLTSILETNKKMGLDNRKKVIVDKHSKEIETLLKILRNPGYDKWKQNLKDSIEKGNPSPIFNDLLVLIFKIRCRLFHGDKTYGYMGGGNEEVLVIANNILEEILEHCFERFKQIEHLLPEMRA